MGKYVVGDVQGCFHSVERLLATIDFRTASDELLFAGDLVNRGRHSLDMLRWAAQSRCRTVLGNHDLYFLALSAGLKTRKEHTLGEALAAPDLSDLVCWLRHQPLLIEEGDAVLVHAGLHPDWTLSDARRWARALESNLRGPDWARFLRSVFESKKRSPMMDALDVLTRIMMVDESGLLDHQYKGSPERAPPSLAPWYARLTLEDPKTTVLFGHWAALGHRSMGAFVSLDSGCVWGRELTAFRLDDRRSFTVACAEIDLL